DRRFNERDLGDAVRGEARAVRFDEGGALLPGGAEEEQERVDWPIGAAELPRGGGAVAGVAELARAVRRGHPLLGLDRKRLEGVVAEAEGQEASRGEGEIEARPALALAAVLAAGHLAHDGAQPLARAPAIAEAEEQVRRVGPAPVP